MARHSRTPPREPFTFPWEQIFIPKGFTSRFMDSKSSGEPNPLGMNICSHGNVSGSLRQGCVSDMLSRGSHARARAHVGLLSSLSLAYWTAFPVSGLSSAPTIHLCSPSSSSLLHFLCFLRDCHTDPPDSADSLLLMLEHMHSHTLNHSLTVTKERDREGRQDKAAPLLLMCCIHAS